MVTILIVDDSKTFNNMITYLFKDFNYDVIQAYNLADAKDILQTQKIDYIILDLNLPDGNGEDLISTVHSTSLAKVIVMTGDQNAYQRDELFKKGIVDYFLKTSPVQVIVNCTHTLIQTLEAHKNTTILTIDDSDFIRKILKNILESKGYTVLEASSANQAKEVLKYNDVNLILLDLIMPHIDGMSFLEDIKANKKYYNIPVIVVSGNESREHYARVLKQGASDFIKKPFIVEDVLLKCDIHVKSYLHNHEIELSKKELLEQHKLIEQQKKQIEKDAIYLRNILESSIDPLLTISSNGKITDTNKALANVTGISKDTLIGSNFSSYFTESTNAQEAYRKTLEYGEIKDYHLTFKSQDNEPVNVVYNASTYEDENGNIAGVFAALRDITELRKLRDEIEHISKIKSMSMLIGNISHQWRQPLSIISTYSSGLLLQKSMDILTDEIFKDSCNAINDQAQYLSKTIDDFQFLFLQDTHKETINIKSFIKDILDGYQNYYKEFDIKVVQNVVDYELLTYKDSLKQLFTNILNNIKEHAKDNKFIFIDIYVEDNNLLINIKDNGKGVNEDTLKQMFEPYFTTEHQFIGKGLGLYITYQIVNNHFNGTIKALNSTYKYNNIEYSGLEFMIKIPIN